MTWTVELHEHDVLRFVRWKQSNERRSVIAEHIAFPLLGAPCSSAFAAEQIGREIRTRGSSTLDHAEQHLLYRARNRWRNHSANYARRRAIEELTVSGSNLLDDVRLEKLSSVCNRR